MRDVLIPNIDKFDPKILIGLENFVKHSSFLESQWKISFDNWLSNVITKQNDVTGIHNIIIPRDVFFETNFKNIDFWVKLWHTMDMSSRPSNKSINNLIKIIIRGKSNTIILSKIYTAKISIDSIVIRIK
jgi:hypothetical protein